MKINNQTGEKIEIEPDEQIRVGGELDESSLTDEIKVKEVK